MQPTDQPSGGNDQCNALSIMSRRKLDLHRYGKWGSSFHYDGHDMIMYVTLWEGVRYEALLCLGFVGGPTCITTVALYDY